MHAGNWGGMMEIKLNRRAIKFLGRQEKAVNQRIRLALQGLKKYPPVGDIVKMKGMKDTYRLRVGTYRVIFQVDFEAQIIYVLAIDNRGDIY